MAEKQYRTVMGIVQFDPREGEAGGKPVRNIVVRNIGFREQSVKVYATIWPSHADVEIERGDVLILEGSYNQGKGEKDGQTITYHNLSVTRIGKLGRAVEGTRPDTVNASDDDVNDDDIPF